MPKYNKREMEIIDEYIMWNVKEVWSKIPGPIHKDTIKLAYHEAEKLIEYRRQFEFRTEEDL